MSDVLRIRRHVVKLVLAAGAASTWTELWSRLARVMVLWALALGSAVSVAQAFPIKPVTIVVPYPPGGIADLYARAIGDRLAKKWQQPVLVDNRPGAGTIIGTQFVASGTADGHTILLTGYAYTSNQVLVRKMPYEPSALTPLVLMGQSNSVLVLGSNSRPNTLAEVIAQAKSKPGGLRLASSGNGSSPHVAAAQFAALIGADVTHVPYKGTAPAMNDVMGGQVDGIFDGPSALLSVKAGKLKAIAIASPTRHPFAPDVATFRELGTDLVSGGWFGFFVAARTPEPVKAKIYEDVRAALDSPETQTRISRGGMTFSQASPQEFQQFLREDLTRLKSLVANPRLHFDID